MSDQGARAIGLGLVGLCIVIAALITGVVMDSAEVEAVRLLGL